MPSHPFGLRESPFASGHDARFVFQYDKRVEAVTLLRRRIAEGASFVTVTGDSGCGKTSVVTEVLDGEDFKTHPAFIAHPSLTPSELLEAACLEFGAPLPSSPSKPQALAALEHHLRGLRREGTLAVLVLDEAHGLKTELLEEARLLSNMKHEGRGLLQTVLVGLPELERRLGLPELAQLRQRIAHHCRLAPLTPQETLGYVQHRVDAAGGDGPALFCAATCEELHAYTNGFPRDINTLATSALEHAEREGAATVTPDHVRMAAGDVRPGITTVQRPSAASHPFELRRKAGSPRPELEAPRPQERTVVERVPPPPPEVRKPPSFLRAQHLARAGAPEARPEAVAPSAPKPPLEQPLRKGEVTLAESATADAPPGKPPGGADEVSQMLASEHVQELGASVLLVGLLVIVLLVSGRWHPVPPASESRPAVPSTQAATAADRTPEVASTPTIASGVGRITPAPAGKPPAPEASAAGGWTDAAGHGYGFEVAASNVPDSALAVMRRITRGTKLPCRIVTKTTGETYRVVVGPFPSRRDAQKAINELFKTTLVKRAQLVQILE